MTALPHLTSFVLVGLVAAGLTGRLLLFFRGLEPAPDRAERDGR